MFEVKGKYTTAKIFIDDIEPECLSQIMGFINHPAFTNPIAIMPDTHAGKGSVIGFTMKMTDKVIPNVIGVDISCGMLTFPVRNTLYDEIEKLKFDHEIRRSIPFGNNVRHSSVFDMTDFPWIHANESQQLFIQKYDNEFGAKIPFIEYDMEWFKKKCKQVGANEHRVIQSIGSLGGGNHFIEVGKGDVDNDLYITIHSGSRNLGKCICDYWQKYATKLRQEKRTKILQNGIFNIKDTVDNDNIGQEIYKLKKELGVDLKYSTELDYLEGKESWEYLQDMIFCQEYARMNRYYMMHLIKYSIFAMTGTFEKIEEQDNQCIETVHNFIDFNDFIIRKGAISSYVEKLMVIPLNMRDGTLICDGSSNPDWNYSAPHGAGRLMSRSKAKDTLDLETFKEQMKDVFSTSVCKGTLDESPDAYKPGGSVPSLIQDTAFVIERLIPIHNLKDSG